MNSLLPLWLVRLPWLAYVVVCCVGARCTACPAPGQCGSRQPSLSSSLPTGTRGPAKHAQSRAHAWCGVRRRRVRVDDVRAGRAGRGGTFACMGGGLAAARWFCGGRGQEDAAEMRAPAGPLLLGLIWIRSHVLLGQWGCVVVATV